MATIVTGFITSIILKQMADENTNGAAPMGDEAEEKKEGEGMEAGAPEGEAASE